MTARHPPEEHKAAAPRRGGLRLLPRLSVFIWTAVLLLGLWYAASSLVVVVNAFVWMPSFHDLYYDVQNVTNRAINPYLNLMYDLIGRSDIDYQPYAVITRTPVILVGLGLAAWAARRLFRPAR